MQEIEYSHTGLVSDLILDYLNEDTSLRSLYNVFPTLNNFGQLIKQRQNFEFSKRETLVRVLKKQYKDSHILLDESKVLKNLNLLLHKDTFTITTGHQLCLATGPVYVIYKIISAIKLAEELKKNYVQNDFVPIFWLASEDHDFEEINHVNLFGKKFVWQNHTDKMPTGSLSLESLQPLIIELANSLGSTENAEQWKKRLLEAYQGKYNLASATRRFVHEIFKDFGLIVIDANERELKQNLKYLIKEDIINSSTQNAMSGVYAEIKRKYEPQINPRSINFFYFYNSQRLAIKRVEEGYKIADTGICFKEHELLNLIEEKPELFSPNVALRGLYQELILPNLAYIGGPGEIAYWLQLKSVFDFHGIYFPALVLRNSFLLLGQKLFRNIIKSGLNIQDFFSSETNLSNKYIGAISGSIFEETCQTIEQLFQRLIDESKALDHNLAGQILSQKLSNKEFLKQIRKEYKKISEENNIQGIEKLLMLREAIFPNGIFQERFDNILQHDSVDGKNFISLVYDYSEALPSKLKVIKLT